MTLTVVILFYLYIRYSLIKYGKCHTLNRGINDYYDIDVDLTAKSASYKKYANSLDWK